MKLDEEVIPTTDVLKKEVVYDGEGYTRRSIGQILWIIRGSTPRLEEVRRSLESV